MAETVACESCKKPTADPTSATIKFSGGKEVRALVCKSCGKCLADILIKFVSIKRTT